MIAWRQKNVSTSMKLAQLAVLVLHKSSLQQSTLQAQLYLLHSLSEQ